MSRGGRRQTNRRTTYSMGKSPRTKKQPFPWKLSSIGVLIAIIGLFATYWFSRPHIVVDNILQLNRNPLHHEFVIKNSGRSEAKNLRVLVRYEELLLDSQTVVTGLGVTGTALIEGADMAPDQKLQFNLNKFILVRQESKVEATIVVEFFYRDFLRYIPYETKLFYQTVNDQGIIRWRPIGPKLLDLVRERNR